MGTLALLQAELLFLFECSNNIFDHEFTWIPILCALTTKRLIFKFFLTFSPFESFLEEDISFYVVAFLTSMQIETGL